VIYRQIKTLISFSFRRQTSWPYNSASFNVAIQFTPHGST